jgi:hypothetical protein
VISQLFPTLDGNAGEALSSDEVADAPRGADERIKQCLGAVSADLGQAWDRW